MGFTKEIFRRATIRGVADYLLYGVGQNKEAKDYETRLNEAYQQYEKAALPYTGGRQSPLLDAANELTSECASIYTEVGLQSGILMVADMMKNIGADQEDKSAYYQAMYDTLFKRISDALQHMRYSEDEEIKKAVKILETAQCLTEEIYMHTENAPEET